ncbi:hypothetical protein ABEW05_000813 [Botrytis cinerea]
MGVFNSFPGTEVTVCVDDKPLKEYESTEDEVTLNESQGLGKKFEVAQHQSSVTVKKFVESAAGEFFTIKCSILSWAPVFNKETYEKDSFSLTRAVEGNIYKEDKKELLQTLQFTETHLTQCDDLIEAVTRLDGNGRFVGEIEVRVPQAMYLSKVNLVSRAPLVSKTEIPENLLKGQAKSHSRLFGQGEAKSKGKYQKMEFLDGDLETLGVIERSPEPELSFGDIHNSEPLSMPISEPQVPEKSFRDTMKETKVEAEEKLPNNNFQVQDAEPDQNFTPTATSVPASSSNVIPPINSASWNVRDLDPTQTGNSFGQFLQYLQTHGGGQPAQAPPPFPVGTIIAALPNLSTSTGSSDATATSKPPPTQARERRE